MPAFGQVQKIGAVRETGRPLFYASSLRGAQQRGIPARAKELDCFAQFIQSACKAVEGLAMTKRCAFVIALLLTACGEDRPPAPTAEENRQLDEAEVMLNEAGNESR